MIDNRTRPLRTGERTQEIGLLYMAGKRLGESLDLEITYRTVYEIVSGAMACDTLYISSYDRDNHLIRAAYVRVDGQRADETALPPIPLAPPGVGMQSAVVRSGESLLINDYWAYRDRLKTCYRVNIDSETGETLVIPDERSDPPDEDDPNSEPVTRSALLVALRLEGQVIGVVQVISYHLNAYADSDLKFLETLAPQIAAATANARLYQQAQNEIADRKRAEIAEREQRTLAEALYKTAVAIGSALDHDAVMNQILDSVGEVVPHDTVNIMQIEDGIARVVYCRGYAEQGIKDVVVGLSFEVDAVPHFHQIMTTGCAYVIPDAHTDPDWQLLQETAWVRSCVIAPIRAQERVIGFINLDSATPGFFNQSHANKLQAFAVQAGIAIDNARLYDAVHRYALELEGRVIERTAQMNRTTERIEAILNNSSDSIIVTRPNGMIDQVNPAFNGQFDYREIDVVGQPLTLLAGPQSKQTLALALGALVQTGESKRIEIVARRQDGTEFDADVALSAVAYDARRIANVVCSLRDISDRKQLEAELRTALAKEKELNELKTRFVSMVSHEFRTPLTTIQSSSSLLKDYFDRLTPERRHSHLERIQSQVRRLTSLLEDILTVSKMQTVGLDFAPVPLNLDALCAAALDDMRLSAGDAVEIVYERSGGCHQVVMDEKLLLHILTNLLSNAVKYSHPGGIVRFSLHCEKDEIVIGVQDNGIGIPAADQARLFQPFSRATNVGTIKGTGLGLVIAHNAVMLHGGRIEVESAENAGSTFTVYLPMRQESSS
ncbi:MAG: GAF domain-containing protein [Anaerolineae bacterium]|nr:GAF domain-containing protein [Anaerolineae bacterium]